MNKATERLRIGRIPYLNLFPIYYALGRAGGDWEFVEGYPSQVNRMLREGVIDISPSSSIEYLRRPGDYELIAGHSISSRGPVMSILFLSKTPIEKLAGAAIGVTRQTETSSVLLKIILTKFHGLEFSARETDLPLREALLRYGSFLAIGDEALLAGKMIQAGSLGAGYHVYDLGEIWHEKTGLPFVFALWMARRGLLLDEGKKQAFGVFKEALNEAKNYALGHLAEIARHAPQKILSPGELLDYWKAIVYGLDGPERAGLELFRAYASELNLL